MANSIEYAKKFAPIVDDIYKAGCVTANMDTAAQVDFSGVNEVKVLQVSTTGMGDYSRANGYPKGDITAAWETITLSEERGKELSIDRMDNEETLGMAFGTVTGQFMRDWVNPELDAYRFAKYASTPGILTTTAAKLTKDTVVAAIDEAVRAMDENEVPAEGRTLYVNTDLKPVLSEAFSRQWSNDSTVRTLLANYNDMPIVYVPKKRFYTSITLNDGTSAWGYGKTEADEEAEIAAGVDINFMIIHAPAVMQAKKFALPKIFTPDENQDKDMWKFQFRLYHDCYVYSNKKSGVYLHKSTS